MRADARPRRGARRAAAIPLPISVDRQVMLWSWALVAFMSALVRFALVNGAPLSAAETAYAFPVWQSVQGKLDGSLVDVGAPLLTNLTALLFWLFGASDTAARVTPALAGVGLALTPALLVGTIGFRAAIAAAVLLGLSPIAVQLSRIADPAVLTAALTMFVIAALVRTLTDRPWWAPWSLAMGVGLGLASHPGIVLAWGSAAIAAFATWRLPRETLRNWVAAAIGETGRPAVALAAGVAILVGTGGLMDLRGIGFVLGDVWAPITLLAPAGFPPRNLGALVTYGLPLLALAIGGFVVAWRAGDRLALFFGQWLLILVVLAATLGPSVLTFALLPIGPAAVLAGLLVDRLPWEGNAYRFSGTEWTVLSVTGATAVGCLVVVAHSVYRENRPVPLIYITLVLALVLVGYLWWNTMGSDRRRPAAAFLGVIALAAVSAGSIGRMSFGGSPPGTEWLLEEETAPELRAAFHELDVLTSADPRRTLVVDDATLAVVRWYGRAIPGPTQVKDPGLPQFTVREAPVVSVGGTRSAARTPWKTGSRLDSADLNPKAILSWMVSRVGLLRPEPRDIIVSR